MMNVVHAFTVIIDILIYSINQLLTYKFT